MRINVTNTFKKSSGLSLVELMVAMTVSAILMLGISEIFSLNKKSYNVQDENARMQESGRYAFNTLMTDIRRAGFFGGSANTNEMTGDLGISTPGTTCATAGTTWARMIERPFYGLNDTNLGYDTGCIPNAEYTRGDIIVTRYTRGQTVSAATLAANANRLYIRNSMFSGRVFTGSQAGGAANAVAAVPNEVRELDASAYYVGPSGRNCRFKDSANNDIPTPALFREKLSSTGTPEQEEIANGVEHIQFQYGVDSNTDFSVNRYYNANELSNNDTVTPNWTQVVTVRLWVLVRSDCPTNGYTNTKTYVMGDIPGGYTPTDGFKRQLYSTTVAARN